MRVFLLILCVWALPIEALGGAWPRAEGTTFLSFSASFATSKNGGAGDRPGYSLYVERGLKRQVTLGFDAYFQGDGSHRALVFLQRPLDTPTKQAKLSYRLGLGHSQTSSRATPLLLGGLSWGKGIKTGLGPGWVSADAQIHLSTLSGADANMAKLDLTLGLKPIKKLKGIVQLQLGKQGEADPYAYLAPSLVWAHSDKRHFEIGLKLDASGQDDPVIKIGNWIKF